MEQWENMVMLGLSIMNAVLIACWIWKRWGNRIERMQNKYSRSATKVITHALIFGPSEHRNQQGMAIGLPAAVVFLISFFLYAFLFELGLRWLAIVGSIGLYFYILGKKLLVRER